MTATEDLDRVTARLCANMLSVAGSIDLLPPELLTPALEDLRTNLRHAVETYERERVRERAAGLKVIEGGRQ